MRRGPEGNLNLLKALKHWIYPTASKYFSRAALVEGVLGKTDQPFRCLLIDNSPFTEYLLHKAFAEPAHIAKKWKIWIPALKRLIGEPPLDLDMCIAVLPQRYESNFRGLYNFKCREWVRQVLDISDPWDSIRRRFHKNPKETERKIRKHSLSIRVSNDTGDFDSFFYQMYLPHTLKQFGSLSNVSTYEYMRSVFSRGFLLLVMDGDKAISGGICFACDGALTFSRLGVLHGEERYLRKGAQSALYYFIIRLAKDNNLQKVDLMKSRSFLDDGVYRHKREWGATVYPDDESESWVYFFIPRASRKAASFFESNPVIIHTENGLKGVVGINSGIKLPDEARRDLMGQFYAPGIESLLVLSPHSDMPVEVSFGDCIHNGVRARGIGGN